MLSTITRPPCQGQISLTNIKCHIRFISFHTNCQFSLILFRGRYMAEILRHSIKHYSIHFNQLILFQKTLQFSQLRQGKKIFSDRVLCKKVFQAIILRQTNKYNQSIRTISRRKSCYFPGGFFCES